MDKPSLGRGLSSLIPQKKQDDQNRSPSADSGDSTAATRSANAQTPAPARIFRDPADIRPGESVFYVEVEKVQSNPQQPRRDFDEEGLKDLAESIRRHGIIQPLVVTKREMSTPRGHEVFYELIAGERRLRSAAIAGMKHVPVVIRESNEQQKLEVALVENLQRHDLSPLEEARAFRKLMDSFGLSQQEVAVRVGKSRPAVANTMRLLDLPHEVQKGLSEGKISEGHARAMLGLKDPVALLALYNAILQEGLNVRESEERVHDMSVEAGMRKERKTKAEDPEVREFREKLSQALGTKVKVRGKPERGKIVVEFYSREELRGLIDRLSGTHQ